MDKVTVSRSLKQLEEYGFIKRHKTRTFYRKMATTFFITSETTNGKPATCDWKNFK